jgi:GTP-binding protein HflX
MKTLIVECKLPAFYSKIDEVKAMAEAVGYEVVDCIVQRRNSVHHSFCIGPGKINEVKNAVREKQADLIIFTNTLPSSQVFKIQRELGGDVKVIDRNMLILQVFEKRAMTKEAKLQIQLARLKYTFSWGREFLKLQGILGEQVGWSGPGDYPFKEYEKAARKRISRLEDALRKIHQKKNLLRERRSELGYPLVALAGYTQSGKTTFFNRVASESKSVGLGPFTTLSTCARRVRLSDGGDNVDLILIDSIGFIEDMHPIILKAFNATLSEIANANLILLFIDASDDFETLKRKVSSTSKILREIEVNAQLIVCANKIDLVSREHLEEATEIIQRHFIGLPIIKISAKTGENINELLTSIKYYLNYHA